MRRFTSFVAVLVMLVMMVPVLACAATPMTPMEQDCCRQMHGKCGDMAKQGCCHVEVRTDLHQFPSRIVTDAVLPVATVAIVYAPLVDLPASSGHAWEAPDESSPPGLLIASTIVLRI